MTLNVESGRTDKASIKNMTLDAIQCNMFATAAAVNTALNYGDFLFQNINVRATLKRRGKTFELFNSDLRNLCLGTCYTESTVAPLLVGNAAAAIDNILVPHSASVAAQVLVPLKIQFGGPINLRDEDELEIEVRFQSDAVSNDINKGSMTFLRVTPQETVGVETATPYIRVEVVRTGQDKQTFELGDNVVSVVVLNHDKTTIARSAQIIKQCILKSDKFNATFEYEDLIANRVEIFEAMPIAQSRVQSFPIVMGQELDKTSLMLELDVAQITSSNNYVVYNYYFTDSRILELAEATKTLHQAKFLRKVGRPVDSRVEERAKHIKMSRLGRKK